MKTGKISPAKKKIKTGSKSKGKTRIALVGIGGRGRWAANYLSENPNYEIVALCDIIPERMDAFKDKAGFEKVKFYTSFDTCLKKEKFDAVSITTPDSRHAEIALPALKAGKFLFLEKPPEITEAKCRAIIEADRKAGGKTFIGFNLRFAPLYSTMKKELEKGVVGKILTIQTDEFYSGGRTYFRRWNRLREFGGGLWITKSCHDFDIIHWMAGGKPVSIYAVDDLSHYSHRKDAALYCADCALENSCHDSFYKNKAKDLREKVKAELKSKPGSKRPDLCLFNSDKDTFDHGMATVQFEDGIIASHTCNVVCGFDNRRIRVSGTKGTIEGDLNSPELTLYRRQPSLTEKIPLPVAKGAHGGGDSIIFNDFFEFTKGRKKPRVKTEAAMIAVLMGIAANRSVDNYRRVEFSEFPLSKLIYK